MPDRIPEGITRQDVIEAIADFDRGQPHDFAPSTRYDLLSSGTRYPPKAIIGLAARRILGQRLGPHDFKGGEGSRCFRILRSLDFEIVPKVVEDSGLVDFTILPSEEAAALHFIEGAVRVISVNAYERNPAARLACVDFYGSACTVCGFDFSVVYGEIGRGFTHVHHLRELAEIGEEYEVDPIHDLRPVCPNCHAMLHKTTPAMTIESLRSIIEDYRKRSTDG